MPENGQHANAKERLEKHASIIEPAHSIVRKLAQNGFKALFAGGGAKGCGVWAGHWN